MSKLLQQVDQETMLRSAHRLMRRTAYYRTGYVPLWSFVREITSRGSTTSTSICRELGWKPDANMRDRLPPRG